MAGAGESSERGILFSMRRGRAIRKRRSRALHKLIDELIFTP
jgi:hypothetical protein